MTQALWKDRYLLLGPDAALKHLETPYVYHIAKDELYEIDDTAAAFLQSCNGTMPGRELTDDDEFVSYCLEEGILTTLSDPERSDIPMGEKTDPSLRYLELQLTHRCNLRCGHCYIGQPPRVLDMPPETAAAVVREFSDMGGLRLLISGGEPLLYGPLDTFFSAVRDLPVRRVLFTNGTLLDPQAMARIDVHEIQFSLDGWQTGHELLRGTGTFERTIEGVKIAREHGIDISFSTMIHAGNIGEFDRMAAFIEEAGALEWGVDMPCPPGGPGTPHSPPIDPEKWVPLMEYAFGGGIHGASGNEGGNGGFACGRHLMTVGPDGSAAKCGFYMAHPVGNIREGVRACWERIDHVRLADLACSGCAYLSECRGGCRFRAPGPLAPDPVMCRLYGVFPRAGAEPAPEGS